MLGANVIVAQLPGLVQGQLNGPFRPGSKTYLSRHGTRPGSDELFYLFPDLFPGYAELRQNLMGSARSFSDQTQQQVLSTHIGILEPPCFFLGQQHYPLGPLCKTSKHNIFTSILIAVLQPFPDQGRPLGVPFPAALLLAGYFLDIGRLTQD